jgi:hypothetical protein
MIDSGSRLWIKSAVPNQQWVPPSQSARLSLAEQRRMFTFHYAVIEPSSGKVLAEQTGREQDFPYAMFKKSTLAYRLTSDPATDVPMVEIVEYHLRPKPGRLPQMCE